MPLRIPKPLVIALVLSGMRLNGQDAAVRVDVTDIQRRVTKKWLVFPDKVDYTVLWEARAQGADGNWVAGPAGLEYKVLCRSGGGYPIISGPLRENLHTFRGLPAGKPYGFVVQAFRDGLQVAESDTARDLAGRPGGAGYPEAEGLDAAGSAGTPPVYWWERYLPISGRWFYAWRPSIYDDSSAVGRMVFWLLWECWLVGLYLILFRCMPKLSLYKIFPMRRMRVRYLFRDLNRNYTARLSPEYSSILERWKQIIDASNWSVREFIEKRRGHLESSSLDISGAGVKYWSERGSHEVKKLIDEMTRKNLDGYPTVRVFKAGLDNHEMGGFRWMDVAKEVERAIENQASAEIEVLKRESIFEFLWNLGTLTPLLGLLGTVTGISKSFDDLSNLPESASQKELIHQLAGGIHEALWTTIQGLIFGILFMLIYYYYQKKLEWVYSKWEEDYVTVAEKL